MAEERTLGQLVAQASEDLTSLVRAEIALAKAEIRADARNAAFAGGLFGAAGYLGLLASVTLVITVAYALVAVGLRPWLAFLIVSVVLLLIAGILALVGRSRLRRLKPPERTIRTTKEAIAAVKPGHNGQ
jgi:Putative Actinobacterial Holin-X, holin superfamily III